MENLYVLVLFAIFISISICKNMEMHMRINNIKKQLDEKKRILKFISPMIDSGFMMFMRMDTDGNIKHISPALEERLGYDKGEVQNINIKELSCSEELIIEQQNMEKLLSGDMQNYIMDKCIKDKQGRCIWFHCNNVLVEREEENEKEFIIYCIDIDWRKQTENSLIQSFELNELILNSIDTKIAAFDDNGDVIAVNRAMEHFCMNNNLTSSVRKGSSFKEMHTSLSGKDFLYNENIRAVFAGLRDSYTFEYCYEQNLKKNWYLTSISSFKNHMGAIVTYTDITKQKKLEEKLIKSEDRYRMLLALLPVAVFLSGKNGIEYCNDEGLKLLGLENIKDTSGKLLINYVHCDYKIDFREKFMESSSVDVCNSTGMLVNSQGETVPVEIEHTKLLYEDESMSLFIIKDISERIKVDNFKKAVEEKSKELQEAKEYDKVKTEFFANISHELRTPINIIFSALQVMGLKKEQPSEFGIDKYMGMIKQNCYRLLRLVNNLIDITRIDSGFFNISINNYDIINIIENIALSVAQYVENRNIELIFDTELEEKIIACDPDKIERIVLNILANSVKFTPEGGQIKVNIYDKIDEIHVSIKDTGVGIPRDKLSIIFERFRQVDKTLSRNREGSGIGLSLVKSLIELHGGNIEVKSDLGKGTEFIFTLPVRTVEEHCGVTDSTNQWQENVEKIDVEFSDIYS